MPTIYRHGQRFDVTEGAYRLFLIAEKYLRPGGEVTPLPFLPWPMLRMDCAGVQAADLHTREWRTAAVQGDDCAIPEEQVPEFVLALWEARERLAAQAARRAAN